jgi:hypothetical protein
MSRQLSKLQRDILAAAVERGGTLTYREAYAQFVPGKRLALPRPNAIYVAGKPAPPSARSLALHQKFPARAERIRHTMHRLVRRGLAAFTFSDAHLLRNEAWRLESGYVRNTKPSGISVTLPSNRTLGKTGHPRKKNFLKRGHDVTL